MLASDPANSQESGGPWRLGPQLILVALEGRCERFDPAIEPGQAGGEWLCLFAQDFDFDRLGGREQVHVDGGETRFEPVRSHAGGVTYVSGTEGHPCLAPLA